MGLQHTIKAVIQKGENYYVAECMEIPVVTQGKTIDETIANLQEAVALHLEGEDLNELGLAPHPTLIVTMEVEPVLDTNTWEGYNQLQPGWGMYSPPAGEF